MGVLILITLSIVGFLVAGSFVDTLPREYRQRPCMGAMWRRRFPVASKQTIRQFLFFFAETFAIRERRALLFGPDDKLLAIYRARYPSQLTPDALEFETLAQQLQKQHRIILSSFWHDDLTLGELFIKFSAAQLETQTNISSNEWTM